MVAVTIGTPQIDGRFCAFSNTLTSPTHMRTWKDTMLHSVLRVGCPLVFAMATTACDSHANPAAPTRVQAAATERGRLVVLGDSLAVSPSRDLGFPSIIQEKVDKEGLPWKVINAGVRGDTTTGGLRRFDEVMADKPDVLLLALGANDGLRGVDTAAIRRNLDEMITRAKGRGIKVVLCGMETPPIRGWAYTLAFHNIFPELARAHDLPLVPFLLAGVALDPEMNGSDMIHPNAAGARRIAETVWPFLEPILRAAPAAARSPRHS
jgi:acyl-CoA thioesterase-1